MLEIDAVLTKIGFIRGAPSRLTSDIFYFDFDEFRLTAELLHDVVGRPVFNFSGQSTNGRTMQFAEFTIPREVSSEEQGLALLSYYLRSYIIKSPPAWLAEGHSLKNHLPWMIDIKEALADCRVERNWFRPAITSLRAYAENAAPDDLIEIYHDGRALTFKNDDFYVTMPASGKSWDSHVSIEVSELERLPKRLKESIEIKSFEDLLSVSGNLLCAVTNKVVSKTP